MSRKYDCCGWATKFDVRCTDGRILRKGAFTNSEPTVPLVWNHDHSDPSNILGHADLENRDEGVYAYCYFNDTPRARYAKELVQHGDITRFSIFANKLKQVGSEVIHGMIREVSLVLAGANSEAVIDDCMAHYDENDEWEAYIYAGGDVSLYHSEEKSNEDTNVSTNTNSNEETVKDVFDTLTEKQKTAVYAIIGEVMDRNNSDDDDDEGDDSMGHNVFENSNIDDRNTLTHSEMETIIGDGKRYGSLRESFMAHAEEYGIDNIEYLFPEARNLNTPPEFISREMGWVSKVMNGVHRYPFSRIKSMFADITEDEARACGYIKGNLKKEEVFSLLKRTTTPTTIYKKQKMDRDDVVDITDFDVIAWLKREMRMMLDEEIARSILIGDGRLASSDDKISEDHIRPIFKDSDLFTVKKTVDVASAATSDQVAKAFIKTVVRARKDYKGSGSPTLFTTEDVITEMLLIEDTTGRVIYDTLEKLKNVLRVSDIVAVPVMEGVQDSSSKPLLALMVNLKDYAVGADKGGAINMFDDFDIDYNQQKYLIETRCSGALIKPYSAISFVKNVT